jgi:hypothetical protein
VQPNQPSAHFHRSKAQLRDRLDSLAQELQPNMIVYRGQPHNGIIAVWRHMFPSVTTLVCAGDQQMTLTAAVGGLPGGRSSRWPGWSSRLQDFIEALYRDHEGRHVNLRYRLQPNYGRIRLDREARRLYDFHGVGRAGERVLDQEMYRWSSRFPQSCVVAELVSRLSSGHATSSLAELMPLFPQRTPCSAIACLEVVLDPAPRGALNDHPGLLRALDRLRSRSILPRVGERHPRGLPGPIARDRTPLRGVSRDPSLALRVAALRHRPSIEKREPGEHEADFQHDVRTADRGWQADGDGASAVYQR